MIRKVMSFIMDLKKCLYSMIITETSTLFNPISALHIKLIQTSIASLINSVDPDQLASDEAS